MGWANVNDGYDQCNTATLRWSGSRAARFNVFSHEHAIAFDVLIQSGARPIQSSVQRNRRSRCTLRVPREEQESTPAVTACVQRWRRKDFASSEDPPGAYKAP